MRRLLITVTAVITTLAMAGCAGAKADDDGVATAGGKPSSTGANSDAGADNGDTGEKMRQFAKCMREHGVDMPDPEVDGEGRVRVRVGGGGDGAVDRTKMEAAQKACQQYLPNGGEPPQLDPAQAEKMRQFAKCMRENGVPDFPDPQADGSMRIEFGGNLDPDSPAFKAAEATCEQYRPRPAAGGGS